MKKRNKKGFFLSETMVVIAVVAVVLLGVFKLFSSVYYGFTESENYNTTNAINALSNIQKYYESLAEIDITMLSEDTPYINITNDEKYESDYYNRIKEEYNVTDVYLMDLNYLLTSDDLNNLYVLLRRYINTLKNEQGTVLVVAINGSEFAYTKIKDYRNLTLIGDADDEYGVYIIKGEDFVDPGYTGWNGETPYIEWENDNIVDTSKPGTYYLHYDFDGYLFRRKVVVGPVDGVDYITKLNETASEDNGLQQTSATYTNASSEEVTVDAGIRYVGVTDEVNNYVYFNCESKDLKGVSYGKENYDYENSCETWRIIGVFDVEDGSGNTEKRVKIINTESTFNASWDSSASGTNYGNGVNQWGGSTLIDADGNSQPYAGADLMQLLNGYYIGKSGSECKYNNTSGQDGFEQTCDTEDALLSSLNMKPLTSNALSMIDNAVWYTYGVYNNGNTGTSSYASTAYLEERGITQQYTGKNLCESSEDSECNDKVNRTTTWTGLVGLMSVSDIGYANGWLYRSSPYAWSITSNATFSSADHAWYAFSSRADVSSLSSPSGVLPSIYLKPDIQIIEGNGTIINPYKLSLQN